MRIIQTSTNLLCIKFSELGGKLDSIIRSILLVPFFAPPVGEEPIDHQGTEGSPAPSSESDATAYHDKYELSEVSASGKSLTKLAMLSIPGRKYRIGPQESCESEDPNIFMVLVLQDILLPIVVISHLIDGDATLAAEVHFTRWFSVSPLFEASVLRVSFPSGAAYIKSTINWLGETFKDLARLEIVCQSSNRLEALVVAQEAYNNRTSLPELHFWNDQDLTNSRTYSLPFLDLDFSSAPITPDRYTFADQLIRSSSGLTSLVLKSYSLDKLLALVGTALKSHGNITRATLIDTSDVKLITSFAKGSGRLLSAEIYLPDGVLREPFTSALDMLDLPDSMLESLMSVQKATASYPPLSTFVLKACSEHGEWILLELPVKSLNLTQYVVSPAFFPRVLKFIQVCPSISNISMLVVVPEDAINMVLSVLRVRGPSVVLNLEIFGGSRSSIELATTKIDPVESITLYPMDNVFTPFLSLAKVKKVVLTYSYCRRWESSYEDSMREFAIEVMKLCQNLNTLECADWLGNREKMIIVVQTASKNHNSFQRLCFYSGNPASELVVEMPLQTVDLTELMPPVKLAVQKLSDARHSLFSRVEFLRILRTYTLQEEESLTEIIQESFNRYHALQLLELACTFEILARMLSFIQRTPATLPRFLARVQLLNATSSDILISRYVQNPVGTTLLLRNMPENIAILRHFSLGIFPSARSGTSLFWDTSELTPDQVLSLASKLFYHCYVSDLCFDEPLSYPSRPPQEQVAGPRLPIESLAMLMVTNGLGFDFTGKL
ncbi:hypothetical protein BG015_011892 [Linnemannia schmuckeri]|uniref:Uncharacterized protein n=1 Tax=Linnemannia schmuckeri TaxID=64567 RepID=A0A9P5RVF2_9FUNG|nr:hypothetical protein BG015_011892 [Linnemannia schmuckeri]